jgi:hypothetical protein
MLTLPESERLGRNINESFKTDVAVINATFGVSARRNYE